MRFLLFNVAVVAALAYILIGGGNREAAAPGEAANPLPQLEESVRNSVRQVKDRIAGIGAGEREAAQSDEGDSANQPADPGQTADSAPPLPAAREIPVREIRRPPPPHAGAAQRQEDAGGTAPRTPGAAEPSPERTQGPRFMTPAERARELNRLASDMELLFADKVSR